MSQSTDAYASCYLAQVNFIGSNEYYSQRNRKGIVSEYFFLLLCFLIFKMVKNRLLKKKDQDKEIEKISVSKLKKAIKNTKEFDQKFLAFFSNHICCSAIALVWAPYDFAVAACYFNLMFFLLYCFLGELQENETLKKVFYTIIAITQLSLIIAGCRGLVLQQSNINESNCQQYL